MVLLFHQMKYQIGKVDLYLSENMNIDLLLRKKEIILLQQRKKHFDQVILMLLLLCYLFNWAR